MIASENNLVSDHSSSFILTQYHIHSPLPIMLQLYLNIMLYSLWLTIFPPIKYHGHLLMDITLNVSRAHFLYYITSCGSTMSRTLLSPGTTPSNWCKPVDPGSVGGRRRGGDKEGEDWEEENEIEEEKSWRSEGGRTSAASSPGWLP